MHTCTCIYMYSVHVHLGMRSYKHMLFLRGCVGFVLAAIRYKFVILGIFYLLLEPMY